MTGKDRLMFLPSPSIEYEPSCLHVDLQLESAEYGLQGWCDILLAAAGREPECPKPVKRLSVPSASYYRRLTGLEGTREACQANLQGL